MSLTATLPEILISSAIGDFTFYKIESLGGLDV